MDALAVASHMLLCLHCTTELFALTSEFSIVVVVERLEIDLRMEQSDCNRAGVKHLLENRIALDMFLVVRFVVVAYCFYESVHTSGLNWRQTRMSDS